MLYPAFIKLQGERCVVIGGGKVAARKVGSLLECGARVTVISPAVVEEIAAWANAGIIEWVKRCFEKGDTEGAFLVVSATDDREVNNAVALECKAKHILLNVVDQPEFCSFHVPSVIRRGPLAIAVSTGGKSPLLARKIREKLEEAVPPAFGEFLEYLGAVRSKVIAEYPEFKNELLEGLVSPEILASVENNDFS
ncbi:MAG: bifunctional precorrin-2 dehydrogenase/sirohydrochlorin ferrochelatase, partial [Firmicutes bacterium]|nr:bifunctional precorrin-2 dehydrogenase/sirohydrochlorin ferrochelatase [Bacillota bacterium]